METKECFPSISKNLRMVIFFPALLLTVSNLSLAGSSSSLLALSDSAGQPAVDTDRNVAERAISVGDPIVIKKAFFNETMGKPKSRHSQTAEVHPGENFGFVMRLSTLKPALLHIKLIVPALPQNFPCSTCKPGELKIVDEKTVTVSKRLLAGTDHTGFYWGIGPGDPVGKYEMDYYLNGELIDTYQFRVESTSLAEQSRPTR